MTVLYDTSELGTLFSPIDVAIIEHIHGLFRRPDQWRLHGLVQIGERRVATVASEGDPTRPLELNTYIQYISTRLVRGDLLKLLTPKGAKKDSER